MPIKVQKKNGQLEDFDRNKVLNGLIKSGVSNEQAEGLTQQVQTWAQTAAINGVINSAVIRTKVLELLRGVNPTAAAAFESYRKQPEVAQTPPPAPEQPQSPEEGGVPGASGAPGI